MIRRGLSFALVFLLIACPVLTALGAAETGGDTGLPARYDMREDGLVTPVKLQY